MPCPIQACCGNPDARYGREKSVSTVIHNSVNIIALAVNVASIILTRMRVSIDFGNLPLQSCLGSIGEQRSGVASY